ncbi:MAG: hypothetical protein A3I66_00655 [Burkholderiales bacterium RIFCSPLOWO2_02_FULL_57_36]|nr:MAG: hypothetical protein A3I66_00655 [Burkholderiales bacterium RIFCSPLOWO2_02_FULL_57_36]
MIYIERLPAQANDPTAEEPVSLARAKRHLKIDGVDADLDADLQSSIATARMDAENRTRRTLLSRQRWRLTLDAWPSALVLPFAPLLQVDHIDYRDPLGTVQTFALSSIQTAGAQLQPAWGSQWPAVAPGDGCITVDYTAGYANAAAVPLPLVQWILLALGDLDLQRERSAERPALPQSFADELLSPYKIWGGLV